MGKIGILLDRENVGIAMVKVDITAKELSRCMGISYNHLHLILNGKRATRLSTVKKIANYLETTAVDLFKKNKALMPGDI